VDWLHRLPYHAQEILVQRIEVCLFSQLDGEGFEGLPGVVLPPVKAAIYKRLDARRLRLGDQPDETSGTGAWGEGPTGCRWAQSALQYIKRCSALLYNLTGNGRGLGPAPMFLPLLYGSGPKQ